MSDKIKQMDLTFKQISEIEHNIKHDTYTLTFDCEFMRDGNTCYEVMTIQIPEVYENEDQGKRLAIAIESTIDSIKAQKGYDALIKMVLKEYSPHSEL